MYFGRSTQNLLLCTIPAACVLVHDFHLGQDLLRSQLPLLPRPQCCSCYLDSLATYTFVLHMYPFSCSRQLGLCIDSVCLVTYYYPCLERCDA